MPKSKELTLVKWVAVGFLAVYLIHQFYAAVYNPITTDIAVFDSSYIGIDLETYFVRSETLVMSDDSGYKAYSVDEGGKVAKNGVIAHVYPTAEQASLSGQITDLKSRIDVLKKAQNYTDYNTADLSVLNEKINTAFTNLIDKSKNGRLSGAESTEAELLQQLNRKNIVTGIEQNFNPLIAELTAQLTSLESLQQASTGTIKAKESGYFISKADGYETVLTPDSLSHLTVEKFNKLAPVTVGENVIGKVVSDYEWYIVARVPIEYSFKLTEGDSVKFNTGMVSVKELKARVKYINREGSSNESVIVFSCTNMNNELASSRKQTLSLVTDSYSGLKVPKRAIRMVDGVRGVYTYAASIVRFVPVNIVYTTSSFAICEKSTESGSLKLYDEVIVKGKGLYDGKIIG